MTIAEKLQALESIWDDLCQTPDNVSSPAWHGEILRRRDQRVTDGSAQFTDWSQAKREIRDAVPYYRVENGVVRVRAVIDCRRDPAWIRQRLD